MRNITRILLPVILGLLILLGWTILPDTTEAVHAASSSGSHFNSVASKDVSQVISAALAYLKTQQKPDGGIAGFGLESDPDSTARTVLSLAAAGRPMSWMTSISGTNMIQYLTDQAITYTHDTSDTLFPGRAGILLAAVSAADQDPTSFGGIDIVAELEATLNPATGAYSTTASSGWSTGEASDLSQAWAILGLSAAARPVPFIASSYLVDTQAGDGSWGFGDLDTTALAVTALIGSGSLPPNHQTIQNALEYFHNAQLANGGWRPEWDTDPLNADSTGWVLQALGAAGFTHPAVSWTSEKGDPISALVSLQKADGSIGGSFANAYSTAEALYGLTGEALFNLGQKPRSLRALTWLNDLQNPDGSWPSLFGHPAGATADAALAYLAAGFDAHSVRNPTGIHSAIDYLESNASEYALIGPDTAGKLALTIVAAGEDPRDFGMINIPRVLTETHYNPVDGGFGVITNTWHQAYAILGLEAAGMDAPMEAVDTLRDLQQGDGGWKYDLGPWNPPSDSDSTALAMQALIAAGEPTNSSSIQAAVEFLHHAQDTFGGWSSANSTAFAIQGLLSAGIELTDEEWLVDGHSPFNALKSYQKIDGPFYFSHDLIPLDDAYATRQSIPALYGMNYPFSPVSLQPFSRIWHVVDPDRGVVSQPVYTWGEGISVTLPIGSDLNRDTQLTLDWRTRGNGEWITETLTQREEGYFSASLPVTEPEFYELRLDYSDPEGIQFDGILSDTLTILDVAAPNPVFLPLVEK